MRELLSKLVAGGLSAAVILLWWPRFFPAEDATSWLIRGVVWTLSFEVLMHALLPLERALWDTRAGSRVRAGASRARLGSSRQSLRGSAAVAFSALAVPLTLLTFAPAPPVKSAQAAPVRHVTEIKRIVKVERRQVRVAKVVPVQASTAQVAVVPEPPATQPRPAAKPTAPARTPARGGSTKRPSTSGNTSAAPEAPTPASATAPPAQQQPVSAPRVVRRAAPA